MIQGPSDPVHGIPHLPPVMPKSGMRADAQGSPGETGGFSLLSDAAGSIEGADAGTPGPLPPSADGGPALLREMSGDPGARMRLLDNPAGQPTQPGSAAVLTDNAAAAADAARRAYAAVNAAPSHPEQESRSPQARRSESRPDIGDIHAAALFRPDPREPSGHSVPDVPKRSRTYGMLVLGLTGVLLIVLAIYLLTR